MSCAPSTAQAELDECAEILQTYSSDRLFYVYHKPTHLLDNRHDNLHPMNIDVLADAALRIGLTDWLIEKI